MKLFILLVITGLFFMGCHGAITTYVDGKKFEEIYSIGLFTPTYQYERVSDCKVETETGKTVEPCIVIAIGKGGLQKDITGPIAPMLMQVGGAVGAGALIGDGLKDSGDTTINNITNSTGDGKGRPPFGRGGGHGPMKFE